MFEELLKPPEKNLLYGKPIPEDLKHLYLGVYKSMNGNVPHCGFCDIMNRELGLEYDTNVQRFSTIW